MSEDFWCIEEFLKSLIFYNRCGHLMLATEGDDKNRLYHTTARVITLWFLDKEGDDPDSKGDKVIQRTRNDGYSIVVDSRRKSEASSLRGF